MSKSIVGVDIGAAAIRSVEVQDADRVRSTILRFAEVPVPVGATKQGEVLEPNTVVVALRQLWSIGRFRSKDVTTDAGGTAAG